MYPHQFYSLFPPAGLKNQIFVAMSFHPLHRERWESVIRPAIEDDAHVVQLAAYRVDSDITGDSILTQILRGIGESRLVLAEVSEIGMRNVNVMYELGIAHAVRDASQVLVFRDDSGSLPFDVAHTRVNRYDPAGDPESARRQVAEAIDDALAEFELRKSLAVTRAAQALGNESFSLLITAVTQRKLSLPRPRKVLDAIADPPWRLALYQLLEQGLVEPQSRLGEVINQMHDETVSPEFDEIFEYGPTPLGEAVVSHITQHGLFDGADPDALKKIFEDFGFEVHVADES